MLYFLFGDASKRDDPTIETSDCYCVSVAMNATAFGNSFTKTGSSQSIYLY
jgi:hypothetical protein